MGAGTKRGGLMLVAHLAPKKRGSTEEQFAALSQRLCERGLPVTIVFSRAPIPSVAQLIARAGASVEIIDFERGGRAALRMASLCRTLRPTIVHLHFFRSGSPTTLIAAASGARIVLNDHMPLSDERRGLARVAKRAVHGMLARVVHRRVAVSRYVAESVRAAENVPDERICVIENGINLDRFRVAELAAEDDSERSRARRELGVPENAFVIACVARMARDKGVDVAIRAFAQLRQEPVFSSPAQFGASRDRLDREGDPWLLLVGDGHEQSACAELARALGVADRVRFLGLRNDVERVLLACSQVWVPSRAPEAFGQAAAEAMGVGRVVIASRSGGLPEVVDEERTGLLVLPDDATALAQAAARLHAEPETARAMGRAGRRRAEELFSLSRFVDRVVALYEGLVPAWRTRHADATTATSRHAKRSGI